jgi:PAS domain S-box-containing protein
VFQLEFTGAALGVLVTSAIALGFNLADRGPTRLVYASPTTQVIALQVFLAVAVFSVLPVAAALTRTRQMKASLTESLAEAEKSQAEYLEAQRWARIAEHVAGVGYFRYRIEDERVACTWSDEIYRIHGLMPGEETSAQTSMDWIHPEDADRVAKGFAAARFEGRPFAGQYRVRRVGGDWRTVSCRTVSETDASGKVTAIVGGVVDITRFKMVETAALESEARYRLLAEKSSDVISRVDLEGRHVYVSPASTQMLGYTPEELVGRLAAEFIHPDDIALIGAVLDLAEAGRTAEIAPVMYRFRHKGGAWVWLDTHPSVVCDPDGKPLEFIAVSRDVTRAKQAEAELNAAREAAEAAAQAKSEFLANMSHEIRTPLTSIMGFSGLLKEVDAMPEQARLYVERIATAGQSLLSVVNDILDFSKLEAGQVELDPHPFDPAAFLQETAQLLALQAANKGLDWRAEIDPDLPAYVLADSARLRQVLLNLLGNAIKFTAQGAVTIRATYADGALRVSVADTGQGIPAERRDRLFQRFSQVDGSVSRLHGGTGLGLAIC